MNYTSVPIKKSRLCPNLTDDSQISLLPLGFSLHFLGIACLSTPGCYQRLDLFIKVLRVQWVSLEITQLITAREKITQESFIRLFPTLQRSPRNDYGNNSLWVSHAVLFLILLCVAQRNQGYF